MPQRRPLAKSGAVIAKTSVTKNRVIDKKNVRTGVNRRSSYAAPWAPALAGLFASSLGSLTVHFFGKDSRENPDELVSSPGHMAPAAASDRAADRDAMTVEELCRGEPRALLTASLSRALSRGAQACR